MSDWARRNRLWLALAGVGLAGIVGASIADSGGEEPARASDTTLGLPEVTAPAAFNVLASRCLEDRDTLVSQVANTYYLLRQHGAGESYASLERNLAAAAEPIAPTRCDEVMGTYLALRLPGVRP